MVWQGGIRLKCTKSCSGRMNTYSVCAWQVMAGLSGSSGLIQPITYPYKSSFDNARGKNLSHSNTTKYLHLRTQIKWRRRTNLPLIHNHNQIPAHFIEKDHRHRNSVWNDKQKDKRKEMGKKVWQAHDIKTQHWTDQFSIWWCVCSRGYKIGLCRTPALQNCGQYSIGQFHDRLVR